MLTFPSGDLRDLSQTTSLPILAFPPQPHTSAFPPQAQTSVFQLQPHTIAFPPQLHNTAFPPHFSHFSSHTIALTPPFPALPHTLASHLSLSISALTLQPLYLNLPSQPFHLSLSTSALTPRLTHTYIFPPQPSQLRLLTSALSP